MLTRITVYAKLFTSIYQGTLRGNSHGLLVFTNLLAHADQFGTVDIHPRAIAEEVGLTIEQVRLALDELEAPDLESRTPDKEGRRLVRMDDHRSWGWSIVNHAKYRAIRNEDDRREQNRLAQERFRNKNKQSKPPSSHTETKPYTETEAKEKKTRATAPPDGVSPAVYADWVALRKTKRAPVTATAIDGIRREADKAGISLEAAFAMCCQRGWTGFKSEWMQERAGVAGGASKQAALEARNRAVIEKYMEENQ